MYHTSSRFDAHRTFVERERNLKVHQASLQVEYISVYIPNCKNVVGEKASTMTQWNSGNKVNIELVNYTK